MPVWNNNQSLTVGARGPVLLEDFHLVEKIAQFDRERIPERVVHARGASAKGFFEVRVQQQCCCEGPAAASRCLSLAACLSSSLTWSALLMELCAAQRQGLLQVSLQDVAGEVDRPLPAPVCSQVVLLAAQEREGGACLQVTALRVLLA